jgi:hypothetical protein
MTDSPKCWILLGNTGEYSDHSEWIVRAYTTQEAADADCAVLNAIAKSGGRAEAVVERLRQHDTDAYMDYTGTDYFVTECPLVVGPQIPAASPLSSPPSGAPGA